MMVGILTETALRDGLCRLIRTLKKMKNEKLI